MQQQSQLLTPFERALVAIERALRTVHAQPVATRVMPTPLRSSEISPQSSLPSLTEEERRDAAALMRVNHVGEVCAQALYEAQALGTQNLELQAMFAKASQEEFDHLAWTQQRINDLGGRTSLLNPLWFAGAFAIGLAASRFGDRVSLGFMAETERQVEQHLQSHSERLPLNDLASRAVVAEMQADEARHGQMAISVGGAELPLPVRWVMRLAAKVMTRTAHYV